MGKQTRLKTLVVPLALAYLLTPKPAAADITVNPTITPVNGNLNYTYAVSNSGGSAISYFSLTITGSISSIASPLGWNGTSSFLGSETFVQWTSSAPSYSIGTGGTVSGFSVLSSFSPGPAQYTAIDSASNSFNGQTLGPRVCVYSLSSPGQDFGEGGGSSQLTVFTSSGCDWSVTSSVPWISTSPSTGSGVGVVGFVVAPNYGAPARSGILTISGIVFTVTEGGGPVMSLSSNSLNFAGNGSVQTGPQTVTLSFSGVQGAGWNAYSTQPNISVSPGSGIGNANLQIAASPGASGIVTITSSVVTNSPLQLLVNVNSATPAAPFGSFDTPLDNTTGVAGAIPVTGWALDNIQISKVDIWREPVSGETGLIYIGDAVFVNGARPDVERLYPSASLNYRAGWGYLLLTNFLPNPGGASGNGTFRLHAIAHDTAGFATDLGTRSITVDNAHAMRPFGTIDTPDQGGIASGSAFVNFGWALTQLPYSIPLDGSSITVTIDGVAFGHPEYNQFRADIASTFPGLANSGGAVGYAFLDTTMLTNGVHTISWLVSDNAGHSDGLGSRFFTVFNRTTATTTAIDIPPRSSVSIRRGLYESLVDLKVRNDGLYVIELEELGRLELHLGARSGHLLVKDEGRDLPAGSTLSGGVFYWHPGPGFLGRYTLLFERAGAGAIPVQVNIHPKGSKLQ